MKQAFCPGSGRLSEWSATGRELLSEGPLSFGAEGSLVPLAITRLGSNREDPRSLRS